MDQRKQFVIKCYLNDVLICCFQYCRDYRVMAEHEEMNLPDLEGRPSRRKQTKKKDLQKDGDKIVVEYNIYGVPIGQGRNELRNYIGVIVREIISITYDDWRRVPLEVKEFLWQHFQVDIFLQ